MAWSLFCGKVEYNPEFNDSIPLGPGMVYQDQIHEWLRQIFQAIKKGTGIVSVSEDQVCFSDTDNVWVRFYKDGRIEFGCPGG